MRAHLLWARRTRTCARKVQGNEFELRRGCTSLKARPLSKTCAGMFGQWAEQPFFGNPALPLPLGPRPGSVRPPSPPLRFGPGRRWLGNIHPLHPGEVRDICGLLRGDPAARTSPGCSGRRAPGAKSGEQRVVSSRGVFCCDFASGALRPLHPGDVRAAGSPRSKPQISRTSPGCSRCMFPSQRRPGANRGVGPAARLSLST